MKPTFKTEQARHWYRICKRMAMVLAAAYVILLVIITIAAATDGGILASPIWGLFALIYSLPAALPLAATMLFVRHIIALKTNDLPKKRYAFELRFSIAVYALLWLTALFVLLWLVGIYQLMYAAIATLALALSAPLLHLILQKRYIQ